MITARIIAHSIGFNKDSGEIVTFELEYPRFIHSELMTHRFFSRNAASSRAIPIEKMMAAILDLPAMPHVWGLNEPGMQASGTHVSPTTCVWVWNEAAKSAVKSAQKLQKLGLHKQIVNRVLEPFQTMKTIVTATEWDNWYHLRNHEHAQPEIHILAQTMLDALDQSKPKELAPREYHVPYVGTIRNGIDESFSYFIGTVGQDSYQELTVSEALKVSASCCAQVSYRVLDTGVEKALRIYDSLVTNSPVHASPFEHQATPMVEPIDSGAMLWESGTTHCDVWDRKWSGNLRGWIQYRQLIPNNVCTKYEK